MTRLQDITAASSDSVGVDLRSGQVVATCFHLALRGLAANVSSGLR